MEEILVRKSNYEVIDRLSSYLLKVKKDDKIAFLSDNELAKTVLFQIIAGELEPENTINN